MVFRRNAEPLPSPPAKPGNFLSRMAWIVLIGIGVCIVLRATIATVVTIHGNGMAPTIWDSDMVLVIRTSGSLEAGDVVIYEPIPMELAPLEAGKKPDQDSANGTDSTNARYAGNQRGVARPLPNTAVVDKEELDKNWQRIRGDKAQSQSEGRTLRVGRVLAAPGDTVAFNVPGSVMGLVVNGKKVLQKSSGPDATVDGDSGGEVGEKVVGGSGEGGRKSDGKSGEKSGTLGDKAEGKSGLKSGLKSNGLVEAQSDQRSEFATAWESVGERRYPVFPDYAEVKWASMGLPDDGTPLEMTAEAYLILADNRKEGACCDSRALGWIAREHIEGEVVARMTGDASVSGADGRAPVARGMQWLP